MVFPGKRYGTWALVAGAAEGIGEGFSRELASRGFNLILVDRKAESLQSLANTLRSSCAIDTVEIHLDLATPDAAEKCLEAMKKADCRLLAYVAGWSIVSPFTNLDSNELDGFLAVNTRTLLHLVHGLARRLDSAAATGGIILVSSLAGLIGPKYVATYAATKSFAIRLSEALYGEFSEKGIDILACCSGTVATPTYLAGKPDLSRMKPPFQQPSEVARYALKHMGHSPVCIPGFMNRLQYFLLLNLLSRNLARKLVNNAMQKMYGK